MHQSINFRKSPPFLIVFALEKNKNPHCGPFFCTINLYCFVKLCKKYFAFFLASNFVTELSRSSKSKKRGVAYNIIYKNFLISFFNSFCLFDTSSKPFPAAPPLSAPDKG